MLFSFEVLRKSYSWTVSIKRSCVIAGKQLRCKFDLWGQKAVKAEYEIKAAELQVEESQLTFDV